MCLQKRYDTANDLLATSTGAIFLVGQNPGLGDRLAKLVQKKLEAHTGTVRTFGSQSSAGHQWFTIYLSCRSSSHTWTQMRRCSSPKSSWLPPTRRTLCCTRHSTSSIPHPLHLRSRQYWQLNTTMLVNWHWQQQT